MAVLQGVPGVQVRIVIDDKALQEYDDPESAEALNAASKYVEAVSGKNFEVHTTLEKHIETDHDISFEVYVDGSIISRRYVARNRMNPSRLCTVQGATSRICGVAKLSLLRFSDLETLESITGTNEDTSESLGQIEIQLYYARNSRKHHGRTDKIRSLASSQKAISAKHAVKKSLSHHTSLDEPQKSERRRYHISEHVDKKAFATFTFKYRSLDSLKGLQLISCSPSTIPENALESPEQAPFDSAAVSISRANPSPRTSIAGSSSRGKWITLSDDDIKALLNYHTGRKSTWDGLRRAELEALLHHHRSTGEAIDNGTTKIKRERSENADDNDVVMTSVRDKKRKCLPNQHREVIELD